MNMPQQSRLAGWLQPRRGVILLGCLSLVVLYLLITYTSQLEVLPYGLILVCPLLHLFMHRRHYGHHGE
jgi:Flp pilus assembly protein TadB